MLIELPFMSQTYQIDNVHYVDIRKAFEVCGILSNVYVGRNRNVCGQIYGFERFIKVKDVVKLHKALNNVFFVRIKCGRISHTLTSLGRLGRSC